MLGAAAIALLVIAAIQSKLLVISPKLAMNTLSVATNVPSAPSPDSLRPSSAPVNDASSIETTAATSHPLPAPAKPMLRKVRRPVSSQPVSAAASERVVPVCNLDLAVQHQFKDATLFVWVDEQLALTRPLHGGTQKRMVVFNGIRGVDSETLKIPAGKRTLRVRTLSSDESIDLSRTLSTEFIAGSDRSLQVTFEKHNTVMRLTWQ
jgi:hypothetical protein